MSGRAERIFNEVDLIDIFKSINEKSDQILTLDGDINLLYQPARKDAMGNKRVNIGRRNRLIEKARKTVYSSYSDQIQKIATEIKYSQASIKTFDSLQGNIEKEINTLNEQRKQLIKRIENCKICLYGNEFDVLEGVVQLKNPAYKPCVDAYVKSVGQGLGQLLESTRGKVKAIQFILKYYPASANLDDLPASFLKVSEDVVDRVEEGLTLAKRHNRSIQMQFLKDSWEGTKEELVPQNGE